MFTRQFPMQNYVELALSIIFSKGSETVQKLSSTLRNKEQREKIYVNTSIFGAVARIFFRTPASVDPPWRICVNGLRFRKSGKLSFYLLFFHFPKCFSFSGKERKKNATLSLLSRDVFESASLSPKIIEQTN